MQQDAKADYEVLAANALNRVFGYSPGIAIKLVQSLGSPGAVFRLSEKEKEHLLGASRLFKDALSDSQLEKSRQELETLGARGYRFIPYQSPEYPERLRDCPDAPMGLYVGSDSPTEELFTTGRPAVAVVGTRDFTSYGREWTQRIVSSLSQSTLRPTIVSGLAFGVDITAHMRALECGLPTIAVLPCSIADIYPTSHVPAARRIAAAPQSALVSDFPLGTAPMAATFLRRNRIIAGLADATILVESKIKGGGMITANLAFDYSRDVYALPGRIDDERSEGCNLLIRKKIAEPIVSVSDLCASLGLGRMTRRTSVSLREEIEKRYRNSMPEAEFDRIMACATLIKEKRGIGIDELCDSLKASYSQIAQAVGILESDGVIMVDLAQNCSIIPRSA